MEMRIVLVSLFTSNLRHPFRLRCHKSVPLNQRKAIVAELSLIFDCIVCLSCTFAMDYLNSVNNSMTSVVFSDDSIRKDQTMSCINGNGDNESQSDYVPRPATKSNKQKGTTDCKELQVEENDEDVPMTFPQRVSVLLC